MRKRRMQKIFIIGLMTAMLINTTPVYATVGLSGISDQQDDGSQDVGDDSLDLDSSSVEPEENSDNQNDDANEYDGLENGSYTQDDETTETNQKNMELLSLLQDSWDEDPGGSTYTDDYAYYKIGGLSEQPEIAAPSAILMDAGSGVVLCNKNAKEKKYPASMTKVMTALIAIENGSLDDEIEYSENAVNNIPNDATKAGFSVGDKVTLRDSLYALFMASAADSAVAIAEHYGGDISTFARMMNEKASSIGCENTNFVNPHGLHDENHYTTAYDMALIMQAAIENDFFKEVIETKSCDITNGVASPIKLENHSAFFANGNQNFYEFAKGSKTGHTDAAKYTLVSYAQKENETLISVVMEEENFDNSYSDSKKLFEWGYKKTQVIMPLPNAEAIEPVLQEAMNDNKFEKVKLLSLKYMPEYGIITNTSINKEAIKTFFVMDEDMENGILGYLNISYYDKILIGRTPVLYETNTDGYNEYISYYGVGNNENPITIGVDGENEDNENGSIDIGGNIEEDDGSDNVDRFEEDESGISFSIFNDGVMNLAVKFYIIYGVLMLAACLVTYIIIIIRRKKGY